MVRFTVSFGLIAGSFKFADASHGCPPSYKSTGEYGAGDFVSAKLDESMQNDDDEYPNGIFRCKPHPASLYCSNNAFAPATSLYWSMAWEKLGGCSKGATWDPPTTSPTEYPTWSPTLADWKDGSTGILTDDGTGPYPHMSGCPHEYQSGSDYKKGDAVTQIHKDNLQGAPPGAYTGKVYECLVPGWCVLDAYAPGEGAFWTQAWSELGHCFWNLEPTENPTASPTENPTWSPTMGDWKGNDHGGDFWDMAGCPKEYNGGSGYEMGDTVTIIRKTFKGAFDGEVYECFVPGWCNLGTYAPEDGLYWNLAWKKLGRCFYTMQPTENPTEYPTLDPTQPPTAGDYIDGDNDLSACPEKEYDESDNVDYKAGDIAVVWNSERRNQGWDDLGHVYKCKPHPFSGYCNQFGPGSQYSSLGWEMIGGCNMDYTRDPTEYPTEAPTTDRGNCPPAYIPNNSNYDAGDWVRVGGKKYQCKPYPFYLWCRKAAYAPETPNGIWRDAWSSGKNC